MDAELVKMNEELLGLVEGLEREKRQLLDTLSASKANSEELIEAVLAKAFHPPGGI